MFLYSKLIEINAGHTVMNSKNWFKGGHTTHFLSQKTELLTGSSKLPLVLRFSVNIK